MALVQSGGSGVLVVDVAVSLLLRWPSDLVIFAGRFRALPWARVRLLVFPGIGQQGVSNGL